MAYTTYTPTKAVFADVDLPDDSELETSGIGAIDTPLETIADGLLRVTERVENSGHASGSWGTLGSVMDTITGAVAETVQYDPGGGFVDVELQTGSHSVNDSVFVIATFNAYSDTEDADVRLRATETGGAFATGVVQAQRLPGAGQLVTVVVQGVWTVVAAGGIDFTLEGVNAATPNNLYIYGGLNISAHVMRNS